MPSLPQLRFYTKAHCPLCDAALEAVEEARREVAFDLECLDILTDPELYRRFRHVIPLGELDGREIFRFRTSAAAVIAAVRG
ncbi:MAG: glutaredoxin family protein [Verrucomicrobiae bacterium]|nr:glutaredoxin family protein [Verrucomicrobiae bacterium]